MTRNKIDWFHPEPRKGIVGSWDRFVGPGASKLELSLMLGPPCIFSLFVLINAQWNDRQWTIGQSITAFVLAFDIGGGITTNATACAKRWYHRKGRGLCRHLGFVAVHILHIVLAGLFFRPNVMGWIVKLYLVLIGGSLLILLVPRYVQRSVAIAATAAAILLSIYGFFPDIPGMEWFAPFLFIKMFISHLTFEEPYAKGP